MEDNVRKTMCDFVVEQKLTEHYKSTIIKKKKKEHKVSSLPALFPGHLFPSPGPPDCQFLVQPCRDNSIPYKHIWG